MMASAAAPRGEAAGATAAADDGTTPLASSSSPVLPLPGRARQPDVFDSEGFQAVAFINQIYPDGALGVRT